MKNNKIENLKKQWKNEIYLSLFDEFEEVEYHGYNNIKPLFDKNYTMTFNLSDKIQVELKNEDLSFISNEYCDGWHIIGEYDEDILQKKYNLIYNSKIFIELRSFILKFYNDLIDEVSKFIYYRELEEENYIDDELIKDFINIYLNEKFN